MDMAAAAKRRFAPIGAARGLTGLAIALCSLLWHVGSASAAQRAAVFDFELIDTSLEGAVHGARADEQERLARTSDHLRRRLAESERFVVVDVAPVAAEARASNLQACGGCDVRLARKLGAELAITGTVQKVSNLILNMNIYLRDAETGRLLQEMSADFRGNTDESWDRALAWLLRNRLLAGAAK
jgi:hypothetical protein